MKEEGNLPKNSQIWALSKMYIAILRFIVIGAFILSALLTLPGRMGVGFLSRNHSWLDSYPDGMSPAFDIFYVLLSLLIFGLAHFISINKFKNTKIFFNWIYIGIISSGSILYITSILYLY